MNRILAAAVALALCAPAYADSVPPGLQCDIAVTMTTEPGHKVKTMQAQVGIKFIDNNYWRVLSQDGILKSDAKLTPMRISAATPSPVIASLVGRFMTFSSACSPSRGSRQGRAGAG